MEYVSTSNRTKLDQKWRTTLFIMLFLAITPVILTIAGKFVIKETFTGDLATYQKIAKLLYGGTIILGLIVVALRRAGLAVLTRSKGGTADAALVKLQVLALLGAATGELIGVLGFMAGVVTHDYQFCWRLGVVSLLVILYSVPRRWEWERAIAATD